MRKPGRREISVDILEKIVQEWETTDKSMEEVCKEFNVSRSVVYQYRKKEVITNGNK